jgi:hypothetical protein
MGITAAAKHQLTARSRSRERTGDQTTTRDEPPCCDGRGENGRHESGSATDDDAPQNEEMPGRRHLGGQECAERNRRQCDDRDPPKAVAHLECSRERPHQAEEHHVDADGATNDGTIPSEFVTQWIDENPGGATKSRGSQECNEGCCENHPRVVGSASCHRGYEATMASQESRIAFSPLWNASVVIRSTSLSVRATESNSGTSNMR